ncbi:hypothetical protein SALWKB2_1821 [Snodgrassella alvi wkB2]|nr:hypothetical protein SALWKB2_1821 [Snodgrassella alvi wkB2]ORF01240.1 hypothetical protein BGH96_08605 [Snodgrassella alvi]PCL20222.1 hypothetical protein CPT77_08695 [Snodgrassella alvi]PIT44447.1 hypothetical protein BHC45_06095 [Snodgrassella alvi]
MVELSAALISVSETLNSRILFMEFGYFICCKFAVFFNIYHAYKFQLLIDFIAGYKFAFKVYQLMKQAEYNC